MKQWYIARNGGTTGPFAFAQLQEMIRYGQLGPADHVCQEGASQWVLASTVPGLFAAASPLQQGPPPSPVRAVASPGATVAAVPEPAGVQDRSLGALILSMPKPILFGLCGVLGAGVLFPLAELLLWLLTPQAMEQKKSLVMAIPEAVQVYPGGANRFKIKIARQGWHGDVEVKASHAARSVEADPVTIREGDSETEMVVKVSESANPDDAYSLEITAQAADKKVEPVDKALKLNVLPRPASMRMTASPKVVLEQGGNSLFKVRIARANFDGPAKVRFENVPAGITLNELEIPAGQDEAQAEVRVPREARIGLQKVDVVAESSDRFQKKVTARAAFDLDIYLRPVPKVDVLFVLDLTSSMNFAINGIKTGIGDFAQKLKDGNIDAQVGFVGFRDIVDDNEQPFVLRFGGSTFTRDIPEFQRQVGAQVDRGGGDRPESALQGLKLAAEQPFRPEATKVLILITDADPKIHAFPHAPYSVAETVTLLKNYKINQLHVVARITDYEGRGESTPDKAYRLFHNKPNGFEGQFFDIEKTTGGNAFATMMPKISAEISARIAPPPPPPESKMTLPSLPVEAAEKLPPRPPEPPLLKSLTSEQVYAEEDRYRLLLAIGLWTAVIAAGISLLILAGQNFYLRKGWLGFLNTLKALGGGFLAGLVGGCAVQIVFQFTHGDIAWDILARNFGWGVLGALIGGGMALFVPNLKWYRGLMGGLAGGILGAMAFLLIRFGAGFVLPTWGAEASGRLGGAIVLGFCIGLMVALVEILFRKIWLEIEYASGDKRIVNLGSEPVFIGGDPARCAIHVPRTPPRALRYTLRSGNVEVLDMVKEQTYPVVQGERRQLGPVSIVLCGGLAAGAPQSREIPQPQPARVVQPQPVITAVTPLAAAPVAALPAAVPAMAPGGWGLQLSTGSTFPLALGSVLTPMQLPGLLPSAGLVTAEVVASPYNPSDLGLLNHSRQTWSVALPNGSQGVVGPGQTIKLTKGTRINFGQVQGAFT